MGFIVYNHYYEHGIDEKRRIMIPSQWRHKTDSEEFTMVLWKKEVTPDDELCLMMIPQGRMETVVNKLMNMPIGNPEAETLRMLLGYYSTQVEMDKTGRIIIPKDFADEAGLIDQGKLVGMVDMFAIWNPERLNRVKEKKREKAGEAYGLI